MAQRNKYRVLVRAFEAKQSCGNAAFVLKASHCFDSLRFATSWLLISCGVLQAFLTRAVHQLAESCTAKGISEPAVAKKLRAKGIDLQDLKARAAEVEKGLAGVCQSTLLIRP